MLFKKQKNLVNTKFIHICVLSLGIEPRLPVPQTGVLSVERRERVKNVSQIMKNIKDIKI